MLSKKQLVKLGKRLRDAEIPAAEDLQHLQDYRLSFNEAISSIFERLREMSCQVNEDSICTFRVKRLDSIIGKLRRLTGILQLDKMGDIAGCRCIMSSDDEVYRLVDLIKESMNVTRENVYMGENPKSTGYRSIHLYVLSEEGKAIEVQVRTVDHHDWGTFVEMVDHIYDIRVKEQIRNEDSAELYDDFEKLHRVLADLKYNLTHEQKRFIIDMTIKHDIIGALDVKFVSNTIHVRHSLYECAENTSAFLMALGKDNKPSVVGFSDYQEAEAEYYRMFEESGGTVNLVLITIPNATFKKIAVAYANYLLYSHKFTQYLYEIIMSELEQIAKDDESEAQRIYQYTQQVNDLTGRQIANEIMQLSEMEMVDDKTEVWFSDVDERLDQLVAMQSEIKQKIRICLNSSHLMC
ncbi:MAG: hypothetical protein SNJ33_06670 [Rikenellaceae bacterium]